MPRKSKSKQPSRLKETTRAADDRLRRELEQADPEKFKRFLEPLFGEALKKKSG
jgi:hypothetical protein